MDLYLLLVTVVATIFTLLFSRIFFIVYGKFKVHENKIIIASSPSSSSSPPSLQSSLPIHDVFPSFHGADVRKYFLSHLLKEFGSKGINLFIDNDITRGEFIGPELKKAIRGSRIAIVLLSKRYASSSWCLDELVEIMKCKEEIGQTVMPVFYEVDPSDVKKQAGEFGKVFKKTCKGKTNEVTRKWSQALAQVATLAGYHSKNWETDAKMVEDVVNSTPSRDFDEFIGMEAHMENISPVCSDDYNMKLYLQQIKFLSQQLNQKEEDFKISHLGVARERLNDKKVLVVLDDVDRLVQLEAMARETRWFGDGSRIIITTQDRKILKAHGITHIYKVDFPSDCEAIQMFCMYAFGQKSPKDGFEYLVWEVTDLAGKLPLGLRVMGSYFRGMSKQEWQNSLPQLRRCLDGEIGSILMFSYTALSHENKDLFLHIACFFNFGLIERMIEHLSKRFSDVRQQLNVLAEKSLISLESGDVIMHDLLVQLGRDIVRKQSSEPGQRQFLVDKRETCEVLADDAVGSRSVIGINFRGDDINVSERAFEGMSNLQFLRLKVERDGGGDEFHLFGGPSYLSRKLRLLEWRYFPMTCLNCIPNPELLVELIMVCSNLEKLWDGTKPLRNLKWVDLWGSKNLKDVSSLSTATSLEELDLTGCSSLMELPSSIGNAIHLKSLDLGGCSSLVELPSSIGNATNLQFLSLRSCSSLVELPSCIGYAIRNLEELDFSDCSSLVGVPSSIGNTTNLTRLDFSRCSSLVELPASIGNLQELETLLLKECCKLEVLPANINLKSLSELDLTDCSLVKIFPEISTNIKSMNLTGTAVKQVPSSIRLWHNLIDLFMINTEIQEISPSIKITSRLRRLVLKGCKDLLALPQLPSSLLELDAENCESLERLDCSFLNQKIDLNFANCFKLNKEARDVIIQTSTNKVKTLPGKEMPNYFNYQANGGSLVIKLNERTSPSSMICKAFILLVCKDEVEAAKGEYVRVYHGIKQNRLDVRCSPSLRILYRPLTEHLYIFEFQADMTSGELFFEFKINIDEWPINKWMIKECGVHYNNS
ncbi:LOW QUALITY PROTEIN: probable disease resistance protein RPP1 [Raphanus sativus]|uniref:ADP-ribosyl cyclase/cyclic ADP-ribose hydrolase n=1 Tax=Raphanus sativus TaxID=3726 RepID=A0A9W3CJR7_RAPSA|nr:LOW QUALITY PROTEIN: probable disease resistance protein RPP1 [Raphanus sativus]